MQQLGNNDSDNDKKKLILLTAFLSLNVFDLMQRSLNVNWKSVVQYFSGWQSSKMSKAHSDELRLTCVAVAEACGA